MNLQFDDRGFGTPERMIRWDEIAAVGIRTTADGPFLDDVFWQLILDGGFIELPSLVLGSQGVRALQDHLPGLDNLKVIRAMGSTDERIWRVWHRDDSRWPWSQEVARARFSALVARAGGRVAEESFEQLWARWGEEHRRYHDQEHLADCLRELDAAPLDPSMATVVELALWYHDAIYDPTGKDNEARSAELLEREGAALGFPQALIAQAAACVRATAHLTGAPVQGAAAEWVVDIDLSILGRDVLRFMDFEYAVGEEYAAVPRALYFSLRRRFLESLLASPALYRTASFRERFEARARTNVGALLQSPRYHLGWFSRLWVGILELRRAR